MRRRINTLLALTIALSGCQAGASEILSRRAPSLLVVPYFTTFADVRSSKGVLVYKINPATGALVLVGGSPFPAGSNPTSVAFVPGGRFAYVINKDSGNVSGFKIDAATGAFSPVPRSPFALDYSSSGPVGVAVDAAGKFVYVVSDAGVGAFAIDAATGALATVAGSPFGTQGSDGFGTASIAIDSSSKHAYVLNSYRNTLSVYAIAATGALTLAGPPIKAGQNSNDPGALSTVTLGSGDHFAYETSSCCVNVYAIDAATGMLTPSAHVSLGEPGVFLLQGFAIDPSGKFAYALDLDHIYAYRLDPATGNVKGSGQGVGSGAAPESVTVDPTGTFAYVLNRGSRTTADTLYAYRIDSITGKLTRLSLSPLRVRASTTDPIARWFNAGECAAFAGTLWNEAHPPPVVKRDADLTVRGAASVYAYHSKSRVALHYPKGDSGVTITARSLGAPPQGVPHADFSTLHTTSGLKVGSSAAAVVRTLGRPKIVNGCGQQRYIYLRMREPAISIQFTISNGRVTEIAEDLGG